MLGSETERVRISGVMLFVQILSVLRHGKNFVLLLVCLLA